MAFLGTAIKTFIDLKHDLTFKLQDPMAMQRRELRKLLEKANSTSFGIYHGFDQMLESEDHVKAFQAEIPIFEYAAMNERWWRQQRRLPNITWPGRARYFALSSGTTSHRSKRIPVTEDMLESIRSVGIDQLESLANFDLDPEIFEKDILMLSSSSDLKEREGHLEGEISGINVRNLPSWTDAFYKPGRDIAAIDDWDERVEKIAERAPAWDVAALAGIPSWILLMLRTVIERHNLKTIHDIWPNLTVYASGGVAFGPYRASFDTLTERPLLVMDTYLASEGFFAYNARPETKAMRLALENGIFFEFIPFDERSFDERGNLLENPTVCTIQEVEEGKDYALVASTPAGAWRYMIGDTVRFTDKERFEILLTGRTKYFLNVVGSQLSEDKMNRSIRQLSEALGVRINEFTVAAMKDDQDDYYHQWILGSEDEFDESRAEALLDDILKDINKAYEMARGKALRYIEVKNVPKQALYDWLEINKKKGGQTKLPKIMEEDKMKKLLGFLED
jgi:hypothetical protein